MLKVVVNGVGTIGKRVAELSENKKIWNFTESDVAQTGGLRTVLSHDGPRCMELICMLQIRMGKTS